MPNANRQMIMVPAMCQHSTLPPVPFDEVLKLQEAGLIRLCDANQIYQFQGDGIATVCSDPSLFYHKVRLINAGGQLAPMAEQGVALEMHPTHRWHENRMERLRDFLGIKPELRRLFLFGAHYPCGAARCDEGEHLSLGDKIRRLAEAACHLRTQDLFDKVVCTIFILVEVEQGAPPELRWYHIPTKGMERDT